tara:strand:+ start:563 stop:820 length:258 start_codon:yes stop_codon:yes gene_type:complete
MAITAKGLKQLGFSPDIDFRLENDGSGLQMTWLSASAQPTLSEIEAAHTQWQTEYDAKPAKVASAKTKLEALGLTVDEIKEAFGI